AMQLQRLAVPLLGADHDFVHVLVVLSVALQGQREEETDRSDEYARRHQNADQNLLLHEAVLTRSGYVSIRPESTYLDARAGEELQERSHRQTHDVGERALNVGNKPRSVALDRVTSRLVGRLPRRDVLSDVALRKGVHPDPRSRDLGRHGAAPGN